VTNFTSAFSTSRPLRVYSMRRLLNAGYLSVYFAFCISYLCRRQIRRSRSIRASFRARFFVVGRSSRSEINLRANDQTGSMGNNYLHERTINRGLASARNFVRAAFAEIRRAFNCISHLPEGTQRRSRMDAASTRNKRSTLTAAERPTLLFRMKTI